MYRSDYKPSKKAIKDLILLFAVFSFVSFLYSIIERRFNGDFLGIRVRLPFFMLLFNLVCSLIPFLLLWYFYIYFKNRRISACVTLPLSFFSLFILFLLIWNILITILFGVGVMGLPPYQAPPIIKIFIQMMNRFNYAYGTFIYILATSKNNKTQILHVFLLIALSFLRAGLGVFMYLGIIYFLKYYEELTRWAKMHKLSIIISILIFPFISNLLYNIRGAIRHEDVDSLAPSEQIFGRFIGRLSSFSDSGIILQEAPYFYLASQQLNPFYFQMQAIGGVFGMNFMPATRPEQLLFWYSSDNSDDNVTYMTGTQGNLYISLMKSPWTFLINLVTIAIYIVSTFYFLRLLRFNYSNELAVILLLYVLVSGVSNEFAFLIFSIFVFFILFLVVNWLKSSM